MTDEWKSINLEKIRVDRMERPLPYQYSRMAREIELALAELEQRYREEAKPLIDRLLEIEDHRPPPEYFVVGDDTP